MNRLIKIMEGAPYGFPLGWIAARFSEGRYELAGWDALFCLAFIGALYSVRYLMKHRHGLS